MNFNYQLRFSKTGRARFIAHLDTLSCLVRAVRRAGYDLAFSEGMRPKPLLSLAMPLGVGIEGEDEICDFSLRQRAPLSELAKKLSRELPEGMELKSVGPSYDKSKAASRVEGVTYRIELTHPADAIQRAAGAYNEADSIVLVRRRPKGDKEVDIKRYVDRVAVDEQGRGVVFEMAVTPEGTGRPEELIQALEQCAGEGLGAARIIRTAISLREEPAPKLRRGGTGPGRKRSPHR